MQTALVTLADKDKNKSISQPFKNTKCFQTSLTKPHFIIVLIHMHSIALLDLLIRLVVLIGLTFLPAEDGECINTLKDIYV